MDAANLRAMARTPRTSAATSPELKNYLRLRAIILTLGAAVVTFFTYGQHSLSESYCWLYYSLAIACIAITWQSIRHVGFLRRKPWGLYSQFVVDTIVVTAIIFGSGGPISPFLFLYLPVVMAVSMLHSRRAAICLATFSTLVYAGIVFAMTHSWIPVPDGSNHLQLPSGGIGLQVVGLISAMILIAVATDFLNRKLRYTHAQVEASRRELREFTEHQRQLVNELPDAVVTTDPDFIIISLNQTAGVFLGVDEAQVVKEDIFELLEELDGTSSEIHKAKSRGGEFELSFQKNHHHQHVVCRVRPIYHSSLESSPLEVEISGYLFIFHDVTELRCAEEQLQVHERMAKLLSLASQEHAAPGLVTTKVSHFVGESPLMQQVFKLITRVANSNATVLVAGESGTGKELVARAIHLGSPRAVMPFVPVNCGAIPETLIESELFGYKKGSFTGAHQDYSGLFKQADGGTLFLDEIGELPLHMQTKLLRAIQEKAIRHIGGERTIPVDVRIVAASNKNLKKEVENGNFREDLYYRLNVITIVIPPLRERKEDIPLLVNSILKGLMGETRTPVVPPATMHLLMNYTYPGNVRELENMLERAYVLGGEVILPEHLPDSVRSVSTMPVQPFPKDTEILVFDDVEFPVNLDDILQGIECRYLAAALKKTNGAKKKAAELLGINFRSFRYRLSKFGLGSEESES